MAEITLSTERHAALIEKLQAYCEQELDRKLGNLEAACLLDFITTEIGPDFYNGALNDARLLVTARAELLGEAIVELEKPI